MNTNWDYICECGGDNGDGCWESLPDEVYYSLSRNRLILETPEGLDFKVRLIVCKGHERGMVVDYTDAEGYSLVRAD